MPAMHLYFNTVFFNVYMSWISISMHRFFFFFFFVLKLSCCSNTVLKHNDDILKMFRKLKVNCL